MSPVIDLSSASVKTVSNRIENAEGQENRYGRREQLIEFYPVYSFSLSTLTTGVTYQNNQSIKGKTSAANGTIAKVDGNQIWVKVKTKQGFSIGEEVELTQYANTQSAPTVTIGSTPSLVTPIINSSTQSAAGESITIVARNPVESKILETYDNRITGKSVIWNRTTRVLTLRTDIQPINDDYTARIIDSNLYARANEVTDQIADIFRVGDIISYPNQPDDEAFFMEVAKVEYSSGVDFVAEDTSKNSSSIAKYVTKEVYITNPATAIDVHLLANVKNIENIEVLYKYKRASSQENFEDAEWFYFNDNGQPDSLEIASAENTISSIVEKQSAYQDLKYSVSGLPEFSSFAIKLVMKGVDPAYVPKIQDIRAVAAF